MASSTDLMRDYRASDLDEARAAIVNALLGRADRDPTALEGLFEVLNWEKDPAVRLSIVQYLGRGLPPSGIRALTKAMFDPDPLVRAHAADGLVAFNSPEMLAGSLPALLDALPDPASRSAAQRGVFIVTGRAPEKISVSERERVRLGEHPRTIWPDHFVPPEPPSAAR